jgi:hypothetical protein
VGRLQKLGFGRLGCARQKDHDSRALSEFAFNVDQSAVVGNNAANRGEPQAGALARTLGSEERLEEALSSFRVHAAAIVRDN